MTATATSSQRRSKPPGPKSGDRRVLLHDHRKDQLLRVDTAKFGKFLEHIRKDTASPDDPYQGLTLTKLAELINADLDSNERRISPGIIRRIELNKNVYWGSMMRIIQICRALGLSIVVRRGNSTKEKFALAEVAA